MGTFILLITLCGDPYAIAIEDSKGHRLYDTNHMTRVQLADLQTVVEARGDQPVMAVELTQLIPGAGSCA